VTNPNHVTSLSQELIEIFFYYTIGILVGVLVDREMRIRRRHESTQLELERSHRLSLVGQMAASVAHEIKNPLASIKGAVEILSEDATQRQDREEFKQIVVNEIKRIDGTVKEFLEFARPKETTLARQDLSAGLQASLRQLERQISDSGMVLTSKIEPGVIIQGDQEKIHQVVLNLVLNAIEASDRGSAIEVTLQSDLSQGIRLSVRDHGRGIPPEEIEKIFEPFYSTKTTGTGLGLAIVKSIVEAHGGQIRVTVCDGGGTEVRLLLPLLAAHEETAWR
jgi:signal transduction histidine kinase